MGEIPCHDAGQLELRPVSIEDLPDLLEVYRGCEDFLALGPQPTASEAMVIADLQLCADAGGVFRGIWWRGELIGVLDHRASGHEGDQSLAYIALLMIVAGARGHGLGAAVVRLVETEVARDEAVHTIGCSVQVNNPGSLRFWQRHGYVVVSGPEDQPDGTTSVHLHKPLPQLAP